MHSLYLYAQRVERKLRSILDRYFYSGSIHNFCGKQYFDVVVVAVVVAAAVANNI